MCNGAPSPCTDPKRSARNSVVFRQVISGAVRGQSLDPLAQDTKGGVVQTGAGQSVAVILVQRSRPVQVTPQIRL